MDEKNWPWVIFALFLIFVVPIIINELYKTGKGYLTLWGAADVLSYYGTILGAVATILAVVVTIRFTVKQIQRESYLRNITDKWEKIEAEFSDILKRLEPIDILKNVMDTGFTSPDKAVFILQKYQMTCNTVTDRLSTVLSTMDYPKVKTFIEAIQTVAEKYHILCAQLVEQYGLQQKLLLRDSALKIIAMAAYCPGALTQEQMVEYQQMIDAADGIRFEDIEKTVQTLNTDWVKLYNLDYRNLLMQKGSTFEIIYTEIQKNADSMLR